MLDNVWSGGLSIASLIPSRLWGWDVPWQLKAVVILISIILTVAGITMLSGAKRRQEAQMTDEKEQHKQEMEDEKEKHQKEIHRVRQQLAQSYLDQDEQAISLLEQILISSRCVLQASDSLQTRIERQGLLTARGQILLQVRHMLSKNERGVRANLFEVDNETKEIRPASVGNAGSATAPSKRVFRPEDETYQLAAAGRTRLVPDTSNLPGEDLNYGSFLAAPVITGKKLLGILAVDSPEAGDIDKYDEYLLMQFASLIALTYMLGPNIPAHIPLDT